MHRFRKGQTQRGRGSLLILAWFFVIVPVGGVLFAGFSVNLVDLKADRVRLDLQNIGSGLRLYEKRHGKLPRPELGLKSLVDDAVFEDLPEDPWNHPYALRDARPGLLVSTFGRDDAPGGDGPDADLSITVRPAAPDQKSPPVPPN